MTNELTKLAHEGDLSALKTWITEQPKLPNVHDILWCAMWTTHDDVRQFLIEVATTKKIKPKKKGWKWNDAHAFAISGDPEKIAIAEKRAADFEAQVVGGTPLTMAIRLGNDDFVRALLEKGVDAKSPVQLARLREGSIFRQTVMMTDTTPLGVALRLGSETTAAILMEFVDIETDHMADAVQGANQNLVRQVLEVVGDKGFDTKLFWNVYDPSILPLLAERGFNLLELPTDTGTWGGPIWSWWAYKLRGDTSADRAARSEPTYHVNRFAALFETGVRATTAGLADVLGANFQGVASKEMVDLFLANGANLSDQITWEGDGWDEENDCNEVVRGSIAEERMREGDFEIVQYLHSKGASVQPTRVTPEYRDSEEKSAWLRELGLMKELTPHEFAWVDSPTPDEVRKFLVTDDGIFGLKLGQTEAQLTDWDIEKAQSGEDFFFDFIDGIAHVSREYRDVMTETSDAIVESLTDKFGKPKKRGRKKTWEIDGGHISVKEESNDYFYAIRVEMSV